MKLSFSSSAFLARANARSEISDKTPMITLSRKKDNEIASSSTLLISKLKGGLLKKKSPASALMSRDDNCRPEAARPGSHENGQKVKD